MEAVSDDDKPEIPPNNILANTLTSPKPPRNRPTKIRLNSSSCAVIRLAFITNPIRRIGIDLFEILFHFLKKRDVRRRTGEGSLLSEYIKMDR